MSSIGMFLAVILIFVGIMGLIGTVVVFTTEVWTDTGIVTKVSVTYNGNWVAQITLNTTAHGLLTINKNQLDGWTEPTNSNTLLSARVGEVIGVTYHSFWPCYDISPKPQ